MNVEIKKHGYDRPIPDVESVTINVDDLAITITAEGGRLIVVKGGRRDVAVWIEPDELRKLGSGNYKLVKKD